MRYVVIKNFDATRHRLHVDDVLDESEFEPDEVNRLLDMAVIDEVIEAPLPEESLEPQQPEQHQ